MQPVHLVVVHYHFRPGGVRRVIELAAPHLVRALRPRVRAIVLAAGEAPDALWLSRFRAGLGTLPVVCRTEPALGYVAEQRLTPAVRARRVRRFFESLFAGTPPGGCVVWAHNQGLGRNLALARALAGVGAARGFPLVFHHHDWWFDNRWQRWPEMRRAGFRTLTQVAKTMLPAAPNIRHAAINQADAAVLGRHLQRQAGWLPNPAETAPPPAADRVLRARRWLRDQLSDAAPVWLVPCRLLRRKNLAEALLLTRWLRPGAWLVTTGGINSADERPYAARLAAAAAQAGWKLHLGVLAGNEGGKPTVAELLAASEAVLLTSLQEGFGLPYLEATAARRPLIARTLPNIAPDLARFGLKFPQAYHELLVAPTLFDWAGERRRQQGLYQVWRRRLPRASRRFAGAPALLADRGPRPVPFSRLTLTAQFEVLHQPPEVSWRECAPLNPFLIVWRVRAARGALRLTRWPSDAANWLGGAAYAARFGELLATPAAGCSRPAASFAALEEFIRQKLHPDNLYPLMWEP